MLRQDQIERATVYSGIAVADAGATIEDWLLHADLLVRHDPGKISELLFELGDRSGSSLPALQAVALWARERGRADLIPRWVSSLVALQGETSKQQMILAETHLFNRDWAQLDVVTGSESWGELEAVRLAYQARQRSEIGDRNASLDFWHRAVDKALDSPAAARALVTGVVSWPGWELQLDALLWEVRGRQPMNSLWALEQLEALHQRTRDARAMLRVYRALNEAYPQSDLLTNNLAFFLILSETGVERGKLLARELHERHANDATIASTLALGLLRSGQPEQAEAVLAPLPAEQKAHPSILSTVALTYHALGREEEARALAKQIDLGGLFDREQTLLRKANLVP